MFVGGGKMILNHLSILPLMHWKLNCEGIKLSIEFVIKQVKLGIRGNSWKKNEIKKMVYPPK
jgi:hypothetical protein